jgi:hypothetical protein
VNDVKIHNGDLVLGTYGRGIVILDDIVFLEQMTEEVLAEDAYLFPIRTAEQYYRNNRDLSNKAARIALPNPDYGALITYYLRQEPAENDGPDRDESSNVDAPSDPNEPSAPPEVAVQILDPTGKVIRELTGPDRQGVNRIAWDLRMTADSTEASAGGEEDRSPPLVDVDPGQYTVKLKARGREMVQTVTVVADRRRRPQ